MNDKRLDVEQGLQLARKVIAQRRALDAHGLDGPYYRAFFDAAVDTLVTSIATKNGGAMGASSQLRISTSFTGYSQVVTQMRTAFLDAVDLSAGQTLVFATLYSLRPVQWFNYATSEPRDPHLHSELPFKHVKANQVFKQYIQDSFDHSKLNTSRYRVDRIMVGVQDDLSSLTTIPSYSTIIDDFKLNILLHRDQPVTFNSNASSGSTTSIRGLKEIAPCAYNYLSAFDEEELEGAFIIHPKCEGECRRLMSSAYRFRPLGSFLKHYYHVSNGHKLRISKIEREIWKDYLESRMLAEDFFMVGIEGVYSHQSEPDWFCCLAGDTSDSFSGVSLSCYAGSHVKLRDYAEFWKVISSDRYVQELRE